MTSAGRQRVMSQLCALNGIAEVTTHVDQGSGKPGTSVIEDRVAGDPVG